MNFFSEGKTNWQYLLIVLFLAILLGGGILAWQSWWLEKEEVPSPKVPAKIECRIDSDCAPCGSGCAPIEISQKDICHVGLQLNECACIDNKCVVKEPVTITLDKTEYSQGENIITNANFTGNIYVFSYGAWSIYKWDDNSWVKIDESVDCSSYLDCEKINFDTVEDCSFPLCEASAWYKIEESHPYAQWIWNQEYYTGEKKSYKCKMRNQAIDHECLIYSQVTPGKYKIRFGYALNAEEFSLEKEGVGTQYTEREFTIK